MIQMKNNPRLKYNFFILLILLLLSINLVDAQTKNRRDAEGRKQGYWEAIDSRGMMVYSGFFKDDKPVGEFKRYYPMGGVRVIMFYDADGTNVRARFFGQNGILAAQGNYVNTQRDSVWLYYNYYSRKVTHRVEYDKGKRNGKEQNFYPDGNVAQEIIWENDLKNGACRQFFQNGQLRSTVVYVNDKMEGAFMTYHPNGKIEIEGAYVNDKPDGDWSHYDENGKLVTTIKYAAGKITNADELEAAEQEFFKTIMEQQGRIPEPTLEDLMGL